MYKPNIKPSSYLDLARLYELIKGEKEVSFSKYHIPCTAVVVTQSLVKEKLGITIDLPSLEKIMYEEGMLPAAEYGIPKWYADKWMPSGYSRLRKAELIKNEQDV